MWRSVFNFTTGEIVGFKEIKGWIGFSVSQNFPNPADKKTLIIVNTDRYEKATLIIRDVLGQFAKKMACLLGEEFNLLSNSTTFLFF